MEPEELVRILSTLPPHQLAIIQLIWELVGENGEISIDAVAFHAQDLHIATEEVRKFRRDVSGLVEALAQCQ